MPQPADQNEVLTGWRAIVAGNPAHIVQKDLTVSATAQLFSAYGVTPNGDDPLSKALHGLINHALTQEQQIERILATLKAAGRQHTLVVDQDSKGRQRVRGVFSATQIARQLGIAITTEAVARTFADIEASLGH